SPASFHAFSRRSVVRDFREAPSVVTSAGGGGGAPAAFQVEPSVLDERRYTSGKSEGHAYSSPVAGRMMARGVVPPPPALAASADVDHGPYMADVQRRSKRAWFPPKGNESSNAKVTFSIEKSGQVSNVRVASSSGIAIADEAAVKAVENAAPFRPLPPGSPDKIEIEMNFGKNLFAGKPAAAPMDAEAARSSLRSAIAAQKETGESAVSAARSLNKLAASPVAMSTSKDDEGRVKSAADKTFFLRDGIWTDSSYDGKSEIKPTEVTFGSDAYFELLKKGPAVAKYLSVGKQVLFELNGHWFKIVLPEEG
ncbi:MAG TPA: energy transducer TonB, partial [Chroococcales cyanobacterium]